MKTLQEVLADRPVDRGRVEAHKEQMLAQVRAYRLRELREQAGLTQSELATRIGVGQRQVSKIENGNLDDAKIRTVRAFLEAVGGDLAIEFVVGSQRMKISDVKVPRAARSGSPRSRRTRAVKGTVAKKVSSSSTAVKKQPRKAATAKKSATTAPAKASMRA